MARRTLCDSRAIVTGASSGIGWAIALELARRGVRSIVTARRADRLDELVSQIAALGGEVHAVAGDITDAQLRQRVLDTAAERFGGLDILINNAGVGAIGPFARANEQRLRRIMEVNFFAPAEMMRTALPMLREGRRPIVVNVSSVLGHRAVPKNSEYCASKFALHGLSDAVRAELAREGVDLLVVSPSTTASEFFDNVLERKGQLAWCKLGRASSASVARATVRAIRAGRHEIILSPGGKLLVWLDRLCPPLVNRLVARFG